MQLHTFHIPVMGIGYTIDTPVKVAHLGIASAISLVDDMLTERLRELYSTKYNFPFNAITNKINDFRAERIKSYLNLINDIVNNKFEDFKSTLTTKREELNKFRTLLPETSELKLLLDQVIETASNSRIGEILQQYLHPGSIDVNIMTKLDKENYKGGEKLSTEHNDAHAALRGFATSNLNASIILSAGMNARLYSYMEQFEDFYPDKNGTFRKQITLKVSDYRSAIVQGKIFAKKGLWISEFRIESGLNCGGHAFATQGFLMGPILHEFNQNKNNLKQELFEIYTKALQSKNRTTPSQAPAMQLTAQGGVGTAEEHEFLLKQYQLDSVGWGSPFLLVPEAISIDKATVQLLANGNEDDYFLSNVSPVGVRFNNIKGTSRDLEQQNKIKNGVPGAACTKKFILLNKEYTDRPICTASRQYQKQKIEELKAKNLPKAESEKEFEQITSKSCICNGLGVAALNAHGLNTQLEGSGVSVCPGPNLAYFSKESSLPEMIGHIYGRCNLITHPNRPNLFMKELGMYLNYLDEEMDACVMPNNRQIKNWDDFINNMANGISYYESLFNSDQKWSDKTQQETLLQLKKFRTKHSVLSDKIRDLKLIEA
ncbi:hypothetical protein ACT3CD_07270 [Geofilum sp. OHC36d9]|uniref:hypothetical protein n=1 Tax=Geofilum sp. OHC36d9 TaxID=3458413 RepID=UPI004033FD33